MENKEILVVIPYLAKEAQGRELELAVTGWRKHFKEPYHIVVVGDHAPIAETGDDIEFLPCERVKPRLGQYLPHLDIVHKFLKVWDYFFTDDDYDTAGGFIYACDDMYAVSDFALDTVRTPKLPIDGFVIPEFDWKKESGWWRDIGKTRDLCRKEDLAQTNWVCHLPVYFDWVKLLRIIDRYHCENESYVIENIYFNMGEHSSRALRSDLFSDEVKTSHPCVRPFGKVTWVTNTNSGWSPALEKMLRVHYGLL